MAESAETFLAAADAVNLGDLDALLDLVDEGMRLEPLRAATEGTFEGHDGVRKWWRDTQESFEVFRLDYPDLRDLPAGRLMALGSIHIRGRGSGVETDTPTAVIADFRDGKLSYFKDYGDHAEGLRAAGLAEG
jgi:ketosteroid isomerase-like protein